MEKDKEDQIIRAGGIKVTISGGILPPRSIIMLKSFIRHKLKRKGVRQRTPKIKILTPYTTTS